MTIKRSFVCNFCGKEEEGENMIGLYWTTNSSIERRRAQTTENHLCFKCWDAIGIEYQKAPQKAPEIHNPFDELCPHDMPYHECDACMRESDFQADCARERLGLGYLVTKEAGHDK